MEIRILQNDPAIIAELADLLIETVSNGDSVSFMHPLPEEEARAFWSSSLASSERNERIVLGAFRDGRLVSTVTVLLAFPPNQPHRAEIAKMMTRISHRGQGIAKKLLMEAERLAQENGKTLLVLDTAEDGGAAGLYEKQGFQRAGVIPGFAYKPFGGLSGTILYYKFLGEG